jgi:peptide-methionine (S)-S-oxide reductase
MDEKNLVRVHGWFAIEPPLTHFLYYFRNSDQVCAGATGHTEGLIVYYNPKECTYENLLDAFFNFVNPTTVVSTFVTRMLCLS